MAGSPYLFSSGGGGGWTLLYETGSMGGAGGALSDGDSVTINGVDWTVDGAGTAVEQAATEIVLTRSSSAKTVFGFSIADVTTYDPDGIYLAMALLKLESWPNTNTNHITIGMWRDEGSGPLEMLHCGPFQQSTNFSYTARRENASGGFDTEVLATTVNGGTTPAFVRAATIFMPNAVAVPRASFDASQIALPGADGVVASGIDGIGATGTTPPIIAPRTSFDDFNECGIQAFFAGAADVRLQSFKLFQLVDP